MLKLSPAGICRCKVVQFALMSPDHEAAPYLCCPAKAERVRMTTRLRSVVARWPSYIACVTYSGEALRKDSTSTRKFGFPWSASSSGSDAPIHQPSMLFSKIPFLSSDQNAVRACGLKKSIHVSPGMRSDLPAILL